MTSNDDRASRLVMLLLARTRQGRITWNEGPTDSYIFQGASGAIIVRSRDDDGVAPFQVSVVNDDGVVVREITSSDRGDSVTQLYHAVRDNVLNVDQTLDAFLRDLSE